MTILSLSEGKKSYILVNEVRRDVFIEDIEILNRFSGGTQEEIIIPPRFMNLCTDCSKDQPRTLHSINNIVERF